MTSPPTAAAVSPLLRLPEFRALVVARFTAWLGMSALATVVAYQTYELTRDPLALGLLGLVEAIPALGLVLIGGHVADRIDRRSIVLATGSATVAGAVTLAALSLDPDRLGLAGILTVVFGVGIAAGFERPALVAFEAQVIPIEHAVQGASWTGSAWTAGTIIGPAAGGLAVAIVGIPATYALIALALGLGVLATTRIARRPLPEPQAGERILASLGGGLRYVAGHQVLLGSMALDLFAVFFGGAIAMVPVYASDILHVGPAGLGLLRTAPSAGALIAMALAARFPPKRHAGPIFLVCVTAFGLSMLAFGLSTTFLVSLAALFASGLADGVSVVIRSVILRVESPESMRGRIASVNFLFIGASNELGAFESGVAATMFGVVPSIVGGGLLTLGIVALVAVFMPELRRLDLGRRMVEGPGAVPAVSGPAPGGGALAAEALAAEALDHG